MSGSLIAGAANASVRPSRAHSPRQFSDRWHSRPPPRQARPLRRAHRSPDPATATSHPGRPVATSSTPRPARGASWPRAEVARDWDVAIFGAKGRLVAGSASYGGNELAEGFVRKGERLTIQACRFRGTPGAPELSIHFTHCQVLAGQGAGRRRGHPHPCQQGAAPDARARPHRARWGIVEVLLHGRADARTLRRAGFRYTVRIADLAARTHRNQQRDARHARATAVSDLPSGRDNYRRLPDYDFEMKRLAMQYRRW